MIEEYGIVYPSIVNVSHFQKTSLNFLNHSNLSNYLMYRRNKCPNSADCILSTLGAPPCTLYLPKSQYEACWICCVLCSDRHLRAGNSLVVGLARPSGSATSFWSKDTCIMGCYGYLTTSTLGQNVSYFTTSRILAMKLVWSRYTVGPEANGMHPAYSSRK